MDKVVIRTSDTFRDFIKKMTLNNEIDIPIEIESERILIRRKDLAMKIYGEFRAFEVVEGTINDTLLLGIPNSKRFIKYLMVLDGNPLLIKLLDETNDIDKIFMVGSESPDVSFEVVLSALSQPDVSPLKLSDFFVDVVLSSDKTKKIFEVIKLINSDECGILIRKNEEDKWDVLFKVGSKYEDKGEVIITTLDTIPQFESKFIIRLDENNYFIKFHQQDMNSVFGVIDKTGGEIVSYFRLKANGALVVSEECDDYIIHYGFVPYT